MDDIQLMKEKNAEERSRKEDIRDINGRRRSTKQAGYLGLVTK